MNYQEIIKKTSLNDDRIIVMTAENRAVLRELPNLLGNRFIDTGITEQTMIGSAAGLALRGRIPICHALATFLTLRAFEFIRTDVGIANLHNITDKLKVFAYNEHDMYYIIKNENIIIFYICQYHNYQKNIFFDAILVGVNQYPSIKNTVNDYNYNIDPDIENDKFENDFGELFMNRQKSARNVLDNKN